MKRLLRNQRGMTLAEMLVGVFVMGIAGWIVYDVYVSAGRFSGSEQDRIEVDVSANRVLTVMDQYLRQAKSVLAQYPTSGAPTYTSGDSAVVLALPTTLAGNTLHASATDIAVFYRNGTALVLLIDADEGASSTRTDGTREITANVKDAFFRYNTVAVTSATAATVLLRTQRTVLGAPYTQTALLNVTFRNHP
ncbi:MAG: prepilin-type N-terminal cleavage/methylation domain-containing protein [Candidatus Kerfeldbacteria bacterium]|nr:prepilin-type N-terminal cleavage/methylation domain-containing protein [Candidatus Kerfeldbacteria bacterium]